MCGCAGLSPDQEQEKRLEIDAMSKATLATFAEQHPDAADAFERSLGYAVVDMKVTKVPVFGAGSGLGVVFDKRNDARTYVKVSRFEVGGGLGVQAFKAIVLLHDPVLLDRAMKGAWHFDAGMEAAAGGTSAEGKVSTADKGYQAFKIAEGGVVATLTVRMIRAQPYLD